MKQYCLLVPIVADNDNAATVLCSSISVELLAKHGSVHNGISFAKAYVAGTSTMIEYAEPNISEIGDADPASR